MSTRSVRHLHLWLVDLPVYLHRVPVDFRKQINGLVVLMSESMQLNALKPGLFVFTEVVPFSWTAFPRS